MVGSQNVDLLAHGGFNSRRLLTTKHVSSKKFHFVDTAIPLGGSMKTTFRFVTAAVWIFITLALTPAPGSATTYVMVPDQALADQAPVIAEVRVLSTEPSMATGAPMTEYVMAVEGVHQGEVIASPLTVRVIGGELPDGTGLQVYGAPRFVAGQRALLFLKPMDDGAYRILHFMMGAFHLVEVEGQEYAVRHLSDATEVAVPGKAQVERGPRRLDLFRAWLTDRALGMEREADYFVAEAASKLRGELEKFSLISNPGIRFREFDSGGSVRFRTHSGGQPGLVSRGVSEFQMALGAWRGDPNTPVDIFYGGTTGAQGGLNDFDEINAILFDDIASPSHFDEPFTCTSGGVIAVGGPWFSGTHVHNGETFRTAVGGDIVTNSGLDCIFGSQPYIAGNRRAAEVFTHELGHVLGLGHSCDEPGLPSCGSSGALNNALMRPTVHGDNRGARLEADDRAGIRFLYGEPLTVPANPSGLSATAITTNRIDLVWSDNSSDEASFEVERRAGNGSYSTIATVGTNVRTYQDNGVFPGTTFTYRVRARNGAGVSGYTNTASAMTVGEPDPCVPGPQTLCLNDGRFKVEVDWVDPDGLEGFGTDLGLPSIDSGLMWFFTPNNWELLVKVLDGCSINSHFWVFAAATTDVEYEMRVTDSMTGLSKTYTNQQGVASPAVTDTGAFATCAAAPAANAPQGSAAERAESAALSAAAVTGARGTFEKQGNCVASATRLCLNENRFAVDVTWENFEGETGVAKADAFQSLDSGLMYFFDSQNLEVLVKVLDGCAVNNRVWVFAAATTNVKYSLTVTDTETGLSKSYDNPLNNSADAVTDTNAFVACPTN